MKPEEFEKYVASLYESRGYKVEQTPLSGDYGIDVFAVKGRDKIAIQVKMYGTSRKVNRSMIMELHGAKDYFDCTSAVMVLTGDINPDAKEVADKLDIKIEIIRNEDICVKKTNEIKKHIKIENKKNGYPSFDEVWEKHIMPLKGKVLTLGNLTNKIVDVDWGGITRITSNEKRGEINIEIFKLTYNYLLQNGEITRAHINQEHAKRASSGVTLILSQVPFIAFIEKPQKTLRLIGK